MEAAGGLLGGAITGIGEAILGPRVRGALARRRGGGTRTATRDANQRGPNVVHRENLGRNLPPEEVNRRLHQRSRELAEERAAETREYYNEENTQARQARQAEEAADNARMRDAEAETKAAKKRVSALERDPNTPPDELAQARAERDQAKANEDQVRTENQERADARQQARESGPQNWNNGNAPSSR